MSDSDRIFELAVQNEAVNSLALLAKHKDGTLLYSKYLGPQSSTPEAEIVNDQTVFTLASYTKLPTTVAALKVVERGLISLDDDVAEVLPELARQHILTGFGSDGSPILKPRRNRITLRQLLTHSAGLSYDFVHPELQKFQEYHGRQLIQGATIEERFDLPLVYEPGTSWGYSCSIDWAGKLVERLTSSTLESFLVENVWNPLGASGFTFWPRQGEAGGRQLASLSERDPKTGKLKPLRGGLKLNDGTTDCFGGHGGYSTADPYMKLLYSLLANDGQVLQSQTVDLMFQGQLSPQSRAALQEGMEDPSWAVGDFYPGEEYDWGLGGLLVTKAAETGPRQSGTLIWSGLANLFWFIDRSAEVCGIFMTQVLPAGDPVAEEVIKSYQKVVYELAQDRSRDQNHE